MMIHLKSVLPALLPLLAIFLWHLRTHRRFTTGRLLAAAVFAAYILLVSKYTIFPLWLDSRYIEDFRSQTTLLDGVNLIPLKGLSLKHMTSIQGWGNIALGLPFGFLFPFVMTAAGWREIGRHSAVFAATIETTQLSISLLYGFAYRVIDINDFLLNFVGAMIGYTFLKTTAVLYQAGSSRYGQRKTGPSSEGLWDHIDLILLQHGHTPKTP